MYGRKIGEKLAICPLFAHFYFKSGQAETLGAQGFAGFPRGSPSTLPSTHFFAPIHETPAIAAKIFEISENVWGYDMILYQRGKN